MLELLPARGDGMRRASNQGVSFNNLTVLKQAILYYGPQSVDELVEHMRRALPHQYYDDKLLRETYVLLPLTKQKYFVRLPDGRWDIEWDLARAEENKLAERILSSVGKPLSLSEIRRRVARILAKDAMEVRIDLDSDPIFQPVGKNHYGLSTWNIINDDAYELLARNPGKWLTEREILYALARIRKLPVDSIVFAPQCDNRFKKGPNGTWGLAEWDTRRKRKVADERQTVGLPVPVQVTAEDMERVASRAEVIEAFIRGSKEAVRPPQIVENILGVDIGDRNYPRLLQATVRFLRSNDKFVRVGPEHWRMKDQIPGEIWEPARHVYVPRVYDDQEDQWDEYELPEREPTSRSVRAVRKARSWKVNLTFVHWRNGTLAVPASKVSLFPVNDEITELYFLVSGSLVTEYPVWFNRTTRLLYGLRPIYDSLGMIPGSTFYLVASEDRQDRIRLRYYGEVNEKIFREQSRLMDPDALQQASTRVGRSFRRILIDVMESNPGGLTFWEIFDKVSQIRPIAISTLRNLLSTIPCFYQLEPGSGVWYYDPTKPKTRIRRRKLKAKEGQRVRFRPRKSAEGSETSSPASEGLPVGVEPVDTARDTYPPITSTPVSGDSLPPKLEHQGVEGTSVRARVAALLRAGITGDKALIREYLSRYHGIYIDAKFLREDVPPPETIRRSRQELTNQSDGVLAGQLDLNTTKGRVGALLSDEALRSDDRRLIMEYYRRYHGIEIGEGYLDPSVPTMETIRRARQSLTSVAERSNEADEHVDETTVMGIVSARRSIVSILVDWLHRTFSRLFGT